MEDAATAPALASENPTCVAVTDHGELCGSSAVVAELLSGFGVAVCKGCRRGNPDYDVLPRRECFRYCIPDESLRLLKHISKTNPHNSHWAPMKFYLRRQVKDWAIERFGSLAEVEREYKRISEAQMNRAREKTEQEMAASLTELRKDLDLEEPSTPRERAPKSKSAPKKRKIMDMVSCIRGT